MWVMRTAQTLGEAVSWVSLRMTPLHRTQHVAVLIVIYTRHISVYFGNLKDPTYSFDNTNR